MTIATYRDRTTGRYPITLDEVRALASGFLFGPEPTPEVLDAANVDPVAAVEPPAHDPATHFLREGDPEEVDGSWRQTWAVVAIPPSPPVVTVLYPADLWRRATDAEAEAIDAAMSQQPLRIRRLFVAAQTYQSDDPLWPLLKGAAVQLFGAPRAAELLAPSI